MLTGKVKNRTLHKNRSREKNTLQNHLPNASLKAAHPPAPGIDLEYIVCATGQGIELPHRKARQFTSS